LVSLFLELELFDLLLEVGDPLREFIIMVGQFVNGLSDLLDSGAIGRRDLIPYVTMTAHFV